ncbi:MAG: tetratricopeptide repeat protein [Catenulispora sp.]|nr:tetratricopeptide repeat protein [Catenulispora sp.]
MREGPPRAEAQEGPRAGPLERALHAVAALAPDLDDVGLAEVLFLAAVRDRRTVDEPASASQDSDIDRAAALPADTASSSQSSVTPPVVEQAPTPAVEPPRHDPAASPRRNEVYENITPAPQTTAISGKPVAVPRGSVLPKPLELGRALRPFKRAWAPGPRRVLDVEATARDYARSGQLLPVLKAQNERWLDLALVVDRSPSMAVWRDVAAEFAGVLRRLGAFKRVRLWDLTMDAQGDPRLSPANGSGSTPGAPPPTGPRSQILLLSDCSADGWYQDPIWRLLHSWGATVPTALVNPLPARLWPMTALDLPAVRVASPGTPAARNTRLEYRRPWHLRLGPDADTALTPLPVAVLTPYAIESWARVLMSAGTVGGADLAGCDAVLVPATGRFADDGYPDDFDGPDGFDGPEPGSDVPGQPWDQPLTGGELVEAFFANASTPAARLAVMCAPYTSLTMPLLHLVHQTMVPEATVAELAEVVVSGLFDTSVAAATDAVNGAGHADAPLLRPRAGVQEALTELLGADEAWQMYDMLSRYIAGHAGSLAELKAAIRDPAGAVGLPAELRPFAAATADTLRILGALPPEEPEEPEEPVEAVGAVGAVGAVEAADTVHTTHAARMIPPIKLPGSPEPAEPAESATEAETGLGKLIDFQANVPGIGTTTVAVNVAFILALNGKRVVLANLNADAGQAQPLLDPYLRSPVPLGSGFEFRPVDWPFPEGGSLEFVRRTDRSHRQSPVSPESEWDEADLWRHLLDSADYVLLDGSGPDSPLRRGAARIPDLVVACFPTANFGMAGAGTVLAARGLRVLPVPIGFHTSDTAPWVLDDIRNAFAGMPNGMTEEQRDQYWAQAGVVLATRFSYWHIPAIYMDDDALPDLEALTSWITGGEVSGVPPLDPAFWTRLVQLGDTPEPPQLGPVRIIYVGVDRLWAEWAADVFRDASTDVTLHCVGVRPLPQPHPREHWLFIESEAFRDSEPAQEAAEAVAPIGFSVRSAHRIDVFTSRPRTSPYALGAIPQINILLPTETAARDALRLSFGAGPADPEAPIRVPRPRGAPQASNIRPRNLWFTGRDALLEGLRNHLIYSPEAIAVLVGETGIGKSAVALEYAHRFSADYNVVWWMQGTATAQPPPMDPPRQLWILDDVDQIPDLLDIAPPGIQAIITSSSRDWPGHTRVFEVGGLVRQESISLLKRLNPTLDTALANAIAALLYDRPATLTASATWLAETATSAKDYLDLLERQAAHPVPADIPTDANPIRAVWDKALRVLRRDSPAAVRLLELTAFMAEDVPVAFLLTPTATSVLWAAGPTVPASRTAVLEVVDELSRHSLVTRDGDTFRLRRLFQTFVRDEMAPDQQRATKLLVHEILAEMRPDPADVDDPANRPTYTSIWPHLMASEAIDSDQQIPRWLFLDWLRYLQSRGEHDEVRELAETVTGRWLSRHEALDTADDLHRHELFADVMRARVIDAERLRSEGRFQDAFDLDQNAFAVHERFLGRADLATLQAELGMAADYRALGKLEEAKRASISAHDAFERTLRPTDPRTLTAAAELAATHRLRGDYTNAHSLDTTTLERRRRVLGEDHPLTTESLASVARDDRLLGRFLRSIDPLREAWIVLRDTIGEDHPRTLRAGTSLSASLRLVGDVDEALYISEQTISHYNDRRRPDALACLLVGAASLSALGSHDSAVTYAEQALEGVERLFGTNHPFTGVCWNNLAIYLRRQNRPGAQEQAERAYNLLYDCCGPEHPYTLVAAANVSGSVSRHRSPPETAHLERATYAALRRVLGERHPYTLAVGSNAAIAERASNGDTKESEGLRRLAVAGLTLAVGADNPFTLRAAQGLRIDLELEIEPI